MTSVIIPTYNREQFIAEAIQSVLNQEYNGKLEIIISDDGSCDNTLEIAESFGEKVKIITKPAGIKQGVAANRNRGIKASTQPFISFLDSDDFYLPGRLKRMETMLNANPDLGFVFCRSLQAKEENGHMLYKQWTHQHIFKTDIKNPVISRSNIVNTNSFLFRKEVFDTVGFFNENYTNGEDGDLWMRISEQFKGQFINYYGAVYRINHSDNQLTDNSEIKKRKCFLEIYENAIIRYKRLSLKDPFRIFELKHLVLINQYLNNKPVYYFKYFSLVCRYPVIFFRRMLISFTEVLQKNKMITWYDLEKFLKYNRN